MSDLISIGGLRRFRPGIPFSSKDSITAFAGGGQTSATVLGFQINRITTVASTNDSVKLPAANIPGLTIRVINAATNSANIYGANATDTINGTVGSTAVQLIGNGTAYDFTCLTSGAWIYTAVAQNSLPDASFASVALTSGGTFSAGQLTGANFVVLSNSTNTPGTVTTRTATQMFSDNPNSFANESQIIHLIHAGTGALTVGAGSGVTLNGTAAISTVSYREFILTFTSATSATMTNIGGGLL